MKDIIKRQTASEMEQAYKLACEKIDHAYAELAEAQAILDAAFGQYNAYANFDVVDRNISWYQRDHAKTAGEIKNKIRRGAWSQIVSILEVRKVMSQKRAAELDDRLRKGTLPEITAGSIFDILQSFMQNADDIQKELIKEAYDYLRPRTDYKSVDKFQVGKKVILRYVVEYLYSGHVRVSYSKEQNLVSLDRAFTLLDGAPIPDGYKSPLVDAINQNAEGETEYFKYKTYDNGNLHLTFKRPDLVAKLNAICGGMNFKT